MAPLKTARDLNVADLDGLAERGQGIGPLGDEFLADEALVAGGDDGPHDGRVIDFLGLIDLVAAGHAAGVEVADVLMVLA